MRIGQPRHGQGPAQVLQTIVGLVRDRLPGGLAGHVRREPAALQDEAGDHPVEYGAVVESVIDVSQDRQQWQTVIDRRESTRSDRVRNDVFSPGTVARYMRITYTGLPEATGASLGEIELLGILSVR